MRDRLKIKLAVTLVNAASRVPSSVTRSSAFSLTSPFLPSFVCPPSLSPQKFLPTPTSPPTLLCGWVWLLSDQGVTPYAPPIQCFVPGSISLCDDEPWTTLAASEKKIQKKKHLQTCPTGILHDGSMLLLLLLLLLLLRAALVSDVGRREPERYRGFWLFSLLWSEGEPKMKRLPLTCFDSLRLSLRFPSFFAARSPSFACRALLSLYLCTSSLSAARERQKKLNKNHALLRAHEDAKIINLKSALNESHLVLFNMETVREKKASEYLMSDCTGTFYP